MKLITAIFLCNFLAIHAWSQNLVLKQGEYIHVQARIDEKVLPKKYLLPPLNLDDTTIIYRNEPIYLQRQDLETALLSSDSIDIKDNLSIFYVWDEDGVYQILARPREKSFKNTINKILPKNRFTKIFNTSYNETLMKLRKASGINKESFIYKDSISLLPHAFNFVKRQSDMSLISYFNLFVRGQKNRINIYRILQITHYKYYNQSDSKKCYILQPEYIFGVLFIDPPKYIRERNSIIYYTYFQVYREIFCFMDVFNRKLSDKPEIKYGKVDNNMYEKNAVPFINTSITDSIQACQPDSALLKKYQVNQLSTKNCTYGYTIRNEEAVNEPEGVLVIPGKFLISQRLKIDSVNDIPWEKYIKNLCQ